MGMRCDVNRKLLPGKIAFYTMMLAGLWIYPYIILYFKQLGLTTTECSVIYGALPMFNGFFKLFIGAVADKLQRHKEMMLMFGVGGAVLMNCLQLVPPVEVIQPPEPDWNGTLFYMCTADGRSDAQAIVCVVTNASRLHPMVDKSDGDELEWYKIKNGELNSSLNDCVHQLDVSYQVQDGCWDDTADEVMASTRNSRERSENKLFRCSLDCSKYPDELLNPPESEKVMFGKTFWMTFWFYFVGFNIYASIWVLLYGMNYAILGEKRNNFGRQRLWGTFGALTTAIISAVAMNKYGSSTPEITFTPCFIGFGVLAVITGIVAMFFKLPYMPSNPAMAKDMCALLREPQISLLFVVLFIMGFLFAAADTFLFVYLRSLGASSWTLGVCLFVRFLGEIPSLYYSGHIIKKIGHVGCVYIVLVAYFVRYMGTSLIPNPWWEIPFSLLSSVVFSIGFTAVSVYSSLITPPSMHATLQAMVQTIHFGLGRGTGIFVLGPLMDSIGYRWSFRIASFIAIVTFIFYFIVQRFMSPVKLKSRSDVDKNDEAKEHLQPENGEIKKPPVENGIEVKNSMAGENERNNNPEDPWLPR